MSFRTEYQKKASRLWYILPLLTDLIGGLIGYFIVRRYDNHTAVNLIYVGIAKSAAGFAILLLFYMFVT